MAGSGGQKTCHTQLVSTSAGNLFSLLLIVIEWTSNLLNLIDLILVMNKIYGNIFCFIIFCETHCREVLRSPGSALTWGTRGWCLASPARDMSSQGADPQSCRPSRARTPRDADPLARTCGTLRWYGSKAESMLTSGNHCNRPPPSLNPTFNDNTDTTSSTATLVYSWR